MTIVRIDLSQTRWAGHPDLQLPASKRLHYMHQEHMGYRANWLRVPSGYRVRFRGGLRGDGAASCWFEAGTYQHLQWYKDAYHEDDRYVVEVEEAPHDESVLTTLYDHDPWLHAEDKSKAKFGAWWRLPPGRHHPSGGAFPNDRISSLHVPQFLTVKLYKDEFNNSEPLVLEGPGTYKLADWEFDNVLTAVEIVADDFVLHDVKYDWDSAKRQEKQVSLNTLTILNPSKVHTSGTISQDEGGELSHSEEWHAEAGVTTKVESEITAGAIFAKASLTLGVEVSVSGGYGQSKAESRSYSRSFSGSAELGPGESVEADLVVRSVSVEVPATRIWKSKRTGAEIRDTGIVRDENAGEGLVVFRDPEPMEA